MKKVSYNIVLSIFVLAGLMAALIFAYLLENQNPEFKKAWHISESGDLAEVKDQRVTIKTNRQVDLDSVKQSTLITPQASFSLSFFENTLSLVFDEPLSSSTEYTINIDGSAKDIYGKKFKEFEYRFKTKEERLAFLSEDKRNLMYTDVSLKTPVTLYSSEEEITLYEVKDNEFIVITESNGLSSIYYSGLNKEFELDTQKQINDLDASSDFTQVFLTGAEVKQVGEYYIPQGRNKLMRLNLKAKRLETIDVDLSVFGDIVSVNILNDGSGVLLKGSESSFSLVDAQNFSQIIPLGKFLDITDFSLERSEYLAVESPFGASIEDFPYITIVNASAQKNAITDGSFYVVDPTFWGQKVIFAERYKITEGIRGLFKLSTLNDTNQVEEILKLEGISLELPRASQDLRYIAMESYTEEDMRSIEGIRSLGYQSKPGKSEIILFDTKSNTIVQNNLRGVDLKWF